MACPQTGDGGRRAKAGGIDGKQDFPFLALGVGVTASREIGLAVEPEQAGEGVAGDGKRA